MIKAHYLFYILAIIFGSLNCYGQADDYPDDTSYIKIHFLYGSKPAKGHKDHESKWFGGIHGGHVTIEVNDTVYGFNPCGRFHVFAHKRKCTGCYTSIHVDYWKKDTVEMKYTSFIIPVDTLSGEDINQMLTNYERNSPYDYAFFGMRCAAAAGDVLGSHGIIKKRGRFRNTFRFFYPKKLRKMLFKKAEKNGWEIVSHPGRTSRKWEKD